MSKVQKARSEEGKTELSWGRAALRGLSLHSTCKEDGDIDTARTHLTRAAEIFEALGTTRYLEWTRADLAKLE